MIVPTIIEALTTLLEDVEDQESRIILKSARNELAQRRKEYLIELLAEIETSTSEALVVSMIIQI